MKLNFPILLLFAIFNLSAQPKIVFDKFQYDFGKVNEGDGTVGYEFTFRNTGTMPLIIQDVNTGCECTSSEWSKQPVRPDNTGFIRVSYDVKGRPGTFNKTITVTSNGSATPVKLRITGEVKPVDRHPSEAFRYTAGTIRLDDMHVAFSRMYNHEKSALVVTAYNPGPEAVKISFINLPAHIQTDVKPTTIKQGDQAYIKITYDAARKNDWGFVADQISMILNNDKGKEYKLTVTANIEEDFSRWTTAQLQNAPAISLDQQVIDGGKIKKGEKKTYQVKLTNNGKSKLFIRKMDIGSSLITVDVPKEINPGASADLSISFDSAGQNGEQNKSITMITNDPKNAQIIFRLKVDVIE